MNEELINYIDSRIAANKDLLSKVSVKSKPMFETILTELYAIKQLAEVVPSRTSKDVKLDNPKPSDVIRDQYDA